VRRLLPGEAFGERALLRDDRRSASVTAFADAELVALHRSDFLTAVAGVEQSEGRPALEPPRTAIEALGRQPLLSGATRASLTALADVADAIDVGAGEAVVSKGHNDDCWSVVLQGQLTVHLDDRPPRRVPAGRQLRRACRPP
jgi:hypothetical protein